MRFPNLTLFCAILAGCAATSPARVPVLTPPLPAQKELPTDTGLYGIVLKKPLGGIGECQHRQSFSNPKEFQYAYGQDGNQPCFERLKGPLIGSSLPLGTEEVMVRWPYGKGPAISAGGSARVLLIDGIVHKIEFATRGADRQSTDFSELIAKFGTPVVKNIEPMRNAMGATYERITAGWSRPGNSSVTFLGIVGRIDYGVLVASTAEGTAYSEKKREESVKRGPKL